jgi:flagellar basal body P-ring formation protein FlgA
MKYLTFIGFLFTIAFNAQAADHPLEDIHHAVENFLKQNLDQQIIEPQINIRELSQNLTLPRCDNELSLNNRSNNTFFGRQTVLVECTRPGWRVFVSAEIDGKVMAVTAKRGIVRQAFIQADDIDIVPTPLSEVRRGWLTDIENVVGMRAKRAIRPNTVINLQMLDIPYLVNEGDQVQIITRISGVEIRTRGIALEDGMLQDQIEVRNQQSNIVIKGIVIAPNTLLVP